MRTFRASDVSDRPQRVLREWEKHAERMRLARGVDGRAGCSFVDDGTGRRIEFLAHVHLKAHHELRPLNPTLPIQRTDTPRGKCSYACGWTFAVQPRVQDFDGALVREKTAEVV